MNAALPVRRVKLLREHLLEHVQGDRRGGGSPRRSAEQRGNGFLLIDHHFGTELQHAALLCVFLDDLYALAGLDQFPVFFTRVRVVLFQRSETVIIAEHHLANQVFHQIEVVETDVGHRQHVIGGGSAEQIEERTIFQELGREGGEWPKQHHALTVEVTCIKVRHRHRRRAD
ncbi:Uncharacterised protein [Klebsiella pneumoniae]|nr:Uncharacterised protein [Klebsiella pneumoniae]